MAISMNIFRESADVSHTISKCILIWAIHSNKSAEGKPEHPQSSLSIQSAARRPTPY